MAGTHDCVVIDLSLSFPRRRESIKATRNLHQEEGCRQKAIADVIGINLRSMVSSTEILAGRNIVTSKLGISLKNTKSKPVIGS